MSYPKVDGLIGPHDLTSEQYREYEFAVPNEDGSMSNDSITYRIDSPAALYLGKTTHRIVGNDGVVHCVPAIGRLGCVVRWKNWNPNVPVNF